MNDDDFVTQYVTNIDPDDGPSPGWGCSPVLIVLAIATIVGLAIAALTQ